MTQPHWLGGSVVLATAFSAFYFWAVHLRHVQFDTYTFDFGLLLQVAWNSLHGRWFDTTILPFNYLAEHLSPVLLLASPLFLVWHDPEAFLVLQSVAIGFAGVGIYLVALRHTGDPVAALLLQFAFSVAPSTGYVARDEFHPIALAMPLITFATALAWRGRLRAGTLVAASALLVNEDAALLSAPLGVLVALRANGARRYWGIALTVVSTAWLAVYFLAIVPAVRPSELGDNLPHPDLRQFVQCGTKVDEVVSCLLNPSVSVARATSEGDRQAVTSLLGPTLGLGLLGPSFLIAIPRWLILLLGLDPPLFQAHYVALLVTAAYLATAEALGLLRRLRASVPRLAALGVAGASLLAFVQSSPLPGGGAAPVVTEARQGRIAAIAAAVALVPRDPEVAVAATSSILPHVALRSRVALPVSRTCYEPEVVVADLRDSYPYSGTALRGYVAHEAADPGYETLFSQSDVVVLRRVGSGPTQARDDVFGDAIRLNGYTVTESADRLGLQLFWSKQAPLAENFHYFVHLVDPSGATTSQVDGQLKEGIVPTAEWDLGCPVREGVVLVAPVPSERPRYHLEVGWYRLTTGERLRLADGRDHVDLDL